MSCTLDLWIIFIFAVLLEPDASSVLVKLESDSTETKVEIIKNDTFDVCEHADDKTDKEHNKENEIGTKWKDEKNEVKGT